MSKAIITEQHLHDIADAIIAKGGATAPMTPAQMSSAIMAIDGGGGDDEWQSPSDWPNIREILDNDTDTTYSTKYIFLVDVSLRNKAYGVGNYNWQDRKPSRLRFSDGRVISNPAWGYTFEFDISYGRYQWVIVENNADFIDMPGPGYYPYCFIGLLWIYGPDAVVTGYRANGKQSLQAIEVKTILNELSSEGGITLSGMGLVKVSCVEKLKVGYLKNGVKIGSAQVFSNCYSLRAVPDVLDLSACTNCSSMFANCYSLRAVPDVLDLSACTNCSHMFDKCFNLQRIPTHVTVNISLQFSNSDNNADYLTDPFETDSIAEFDAGGNIVGGFVYNLNVCPNNGKTITFCNFWKSLFTADQWTAIKTALAAKNWGCSPA